MVLTRRSPSTTPGRLESQMSVQFHSEDPPTHSFRDEPGRRASAPAAQPGADLPPAVELVDFARIVDDAPVGILVGDAEGAIHYVNPMTAAIFGYTPAELIGGNVAQLLPKWLRERHAQHLIALKLSGCSQIFGMRREVSALHRDGRLLSVEVLVSAMEAVPPQRYVVVLSQVAAPATAAECPSCPAEAPAADEAALTGPKWSQRPESVRSSEGC